MRINPGFKAWSTLSAMVLSLAVISGCNDEGASTPATPPTAPPPGPAATPAPGPAPKADATPPPPSTPKAEPEKK